MAKCPRCDAPIIPGDQYCGSCGITLQSAAPPGSAPPGSPFAGAAVAPPPPPVATLPPVPGPFLPAQPPPPKRSAGKWVAVGAGLVVVAALVAGAVVFFTRDSNPYPKEWDAQVAPIAARVAQLRGLTFEHPVKVEYVSPADFEEEVTASAEELENQKDEIEQATAVFRAAGLLGGDVDLGEAVNDTAASAVIALYDPESKKILVRGDGPFTVETRVTLAHELTHVLQDQHFDLQKLDEAADESKTGSSDAFDRTDRGRREPHREEVPRRPVGGRPCGVREALQRDVRRRRANAARTSRP